MVHFVHSNSSCSHLKCCQATLWFHEDPTKTTRPIQKGCKQGADVKTAEDVAEKILVKKLAAQSSDGRNLSYLTQAGAKAKSVQKRFKKITRRFACASRNGPPVY